MFLLVFILKGITMKLKQLLFGILLMIFPLNLLAQIDTTTFYDLKLVSNKVEIYDKSINLYKTKKIRLPDTYFFFTNYGIYGADEYGILIYEFVTPVQMIEQLQMNRFLINAIDTEGNMDCVIVVYDYYKRDQYKLFFTYKKKQFIFNCVEVE